MLILLTLSSTHLINTGLIKTYFLEPEVYQFVCHRNAMYDAGKEDYLRPSEHIGLDWIVILVIIGQTV